MTVTSVAVATTQFLFGMCNCMVNNDVGTGEFSLVRGILHGFGHAHVRSHVSQGMDWNYITLYVFTTARKSGNILLTYLRALFVRQKAFKYVKRMLPLLRAVVKFCSINRLFTLYVWVFHHFYLFLAQNFTENSES